jgi:hypothetical protein
MSFLLVALMFSRYSCLTGFGIRRTSNRGIDSTAKLGNESTELRYASPTQLHGVVLIATSIIFSLIKMDEAYSMHGYISIWLCRISKEAIDRCRRQRGKRRVDHTIKTYVEL